jgi:5-(carboxyamino)imidazole ribonucleotide synthase
MKAATMIQGDNFTDKNITLGILGGGQLGMMSAQAAEKIGIRTIIYTPEENSPASTVAYKTICADYLNKETLKDFAAQTDFISYEVENIPLETIEYLSTLKPVYPEKSLLEASQDRIKEKSHLNSIGIPTAKWSAPESADEIRETLAEWGTQSCILKTARFGYDGKGQARISSDTNIDTLWSQFNNTPIVMEEIIDFDCEVSVIIARDINGKTAHFGPMLNAHKNHILSKTTAPAPIPTKIKNEAIALTETLAKRLDLIGVLTLELFITKDGKILANEIAPRTHNSGHWTIDACDCSQFEQHVRTVCGLPVGNPQAHSPATMINLIGDDIENTKDYEDKDGVFIHNYGKTEVKPGRKMGHITILED